MIQFPKLSVQVSRVILSNHGPDPIWAGDGAEVAAGTWRDELGNTGPLPVPEIPAAPGVHVIRLRWPEE